MGDISTWSPVDESNTMAPPNGWPEGQATNTVNNCARALMGGVRRWYDTVTAQLAALTTSVAAKVPLAGGTMTGTLSAPQYNLNGVVLATRNESYTYLHEPGGGINGGILLGNSTVGDTNIYRATNHVIQSNDGATAFAVFASTGLAVAAAVNTSEFKLGGVLFAGTDPNYHVIYDYDGQLALALAGAAGGQTNVYQADLHRWNNNAGVQVAAIGSTGTITAADVTVSGGVTAAGIHSTGGITADGDIAGNTITGEHLQSNGNIDAGGDMSCNDLGATGNIAAGNGSSGGNITSTYPGQFVGNACNIGTGVFGNLDASDIDCAGNIDAASYTRGGVPMVMLTQQELDRIESRLAALETMTMRQPA